MPKHDRDDLTPITDMRGMGVALAVIKRDVSEMKPEVRETAKVIVELTTKQRVNDSKIKVLEETSSRLDRKTATLSSPRPHDCLNANKIVDLDEDNKKNTLLVVETKKDIAAAVTNIGELKQGQSKFIYWLMGAAVIVIGSVVGWYASYRVTTNEVKYLMIEQTKLWNGMELLQKTTKELPDSFNDATERVEAMAKRMKTNEGGVKLEEIWCILSGREKARLRRQISEDNIPKVRCQ